MACAGPGERPAHALIAIYVVMAIAVAAVAIVCSAPVRISTPRPSIAGGYDLAEPDPASARRFDLRQSGEL